MLVGVGLQLIDDKERNHEGELRKCLNGDVLSVFSPGGGRVTVIGVTSWRHDGGSLCI